MPSIQPSLAEHLDWAAEYVTEWDGRVPKEFKTAVSVLARLVGKTPEKTPKLEHKALDMLAQVLKRSTTQRAHVISHYWQGKVHSGCYLKVHSGRNLEAASDAFLKALASAPHEDEQIWRPTLLGNLGFCVLRSGDAAKQQELTTRTTRELQAKRWLVPEEVRELPEALEEPSSLALDLAMFLFCSRVLSAFKEGAERIANQDVWMGIEFQLEHGAYRERVLKRLLDGGLGRVSLDQIRETFGEVAAYANHSGESLRLLACAVAVLEDAATAEALFQVASERYIAPGNASSEDLGDCLVARALLCLRSGDSTEALELLNECLALDTGTEGVVSRANASMMIAEIHEERGDFRSAEDALEKASTLLVSLRPEGYLDLLKKSLACREALLNGTVTPPVPVPARFGFTHFIYRNKLVLMLVTLRGGQLSGLRIGRETLLGRGEIPAGEIVSEQGGGLQLSHAWGRIASSNIVRTGVVFENAGMRREALKHYLLALKVLDFPDISVEPDYIRELEVALHLTRRDQRLMLAAPSLRAFGVPVTSPKRSTALGRVVCRRSQGDVLLKVGFNRLEEGALTEAESWFERVRTIADETHSQRLVALSKCGLGVALHCRGDSAERPMALAEAEAHAQDANDSGLVEFVKLQRCHCLLLLGAAEEVLISLNGFPEPVTRAGGFAGHAWGTAYLGAALRLTNQPQEAVARLTEATNMLGKLGSVRGCAFTLAHTSLSLASLGQEREARAAFGQYNELRHTAGAFLLDPRTVDELEAAVSLR